MANELALAQRQVWQTIEGLPGAQAAIWNEFRAAGDGKGVHTVPEGLLPARGGSPAMLLSSTPQLVAMPESSAAMQRRPPPKSPAHFPPRARATMVVRTSGNRAVRNTAPYSNNQRSTGSRTSVDEYLERFPNIDAALRATLINAYPTGLTERQINERLRDIAVDKATQSPNPCQNCIQRGLTCWFVGAVCIACRIRGSGCFLAKGNEANPPQGSDDEQVSRAADGEENGAEEIASNLPLNADIQAIQSKVKHVSEKASDGGR